MFQKIKIYVMMSLVWKTRTVSRMPWPYNVISSAVLHVVITVCLQVSCLNPTVHVFGHQHWNWDVVIAGVRYVAHCLGSPNDQRDGWTWGVSEWDGPKQVWQPKT